MYEATIDRQAKLMRTMAAAAGASFDESESLVQYVYSDQNNEREEKRYIPAYAADPNVGGEVTPAFGSDEIGQLPINLGYSIINSED